MIKKFFVLMLAMVLVASLLAGCGGSTNSPNDHEDDWSDNNTTAIPAEKTDETTPDNSDISENEYIIGKIINFGGYSWRVLSIENGKALIITEHIIDMQPYNNGLEKRYEKTTWETCDLRVYLNENFYNSFSDADKTKILEVTNTNEDNQLYGTAGGNDTADKVFLLSLSELTKYFGDSGQLATSDNGLIDDEYNANRMAKLNVSEEVINKAAEGLVADVEYNWTYNRAVEFIKEFISNSSYSWALRSPGEDAYWITGVKGENVGDKRHWGVVDLHVFDYVDSVILGIRPAMWIGFE